MAAVDVDRETAQEAAARELAKAIYPDPSLSERIGNWIDDILRRLLDAGSALPGGWLTVVVLGLLVTAAIGIAAHIARRAMGGRGGDRLYGTRALAAADHRARARQAAAQGDWTTAIRQRVRAIGRQLEENGVLNTVPGRTAGELADEAGRALGVFAAELGLAATAFNDVTYGKQPGTERNYRLVSDLDERLRPVSGAPVEAGPEVLQ